MPKKQKVQVTVFNGAEYGQENGWPPKDPTGFLVWFQERFASIPPECVKEARVEIGSQGEYYDEHSPTIEITYLRNETDDQFVSRLQRAKEQKALKEFHERQQYEALAKKYAQK